MSEVYDDPRDANRPAPPDPREPHWIVIRTTKNRRIPGKHVFRDLYRHQTKEDADAEALRLAQRHPGRLFIVYASGSMNEIEVEPPREKTEPAASPVPAMQAAPAGAERTRALTPAPAVPARRFRHISDSRIVGIIEEWELGEGRGRAFLRCNHRLGYWFESSALEEVPA